MNSTFLLIASIFLLDIAIPNGKMNGSSSLGKNLNYVLYHFQDVKSKKTNFSAYLSEQHNDSDWKKVKESEGIMVFTRTSDSTDLKMVKVVAEAKANLSSLVALVKDINNHKNWFYFYKLSKILKKYSETHWIYYGQTNVPWPLSDRDIVSNVVLHQDSITKVVTITSHTLNNYYPVQKDFVRIPFAYLQWKFVPLEDGNVKIILVVEVNVGGKIPLWLMKATATKGPFHTMKNFLREVKKQKYAHIQRSCISEP